MEWVGHQAIMTISKKKKKHLGKILKIRGALKGKLGRHELVRAE